MIADDLGIDTPKKLVYLCFNRQNHLSDLLSAAALRQRSKFPGPRLVRELVSTGQIHLPANIGRFGMLWPNGGKPSTRRCGPHMYLSEVINENKRYSNSRRGRRLPRICADARKLRRTEPAPEVESKAGRNPKARRLQMRQLLADGGSGNPPSAICLFHRPPRISESMGVLR